MGPGSLLLNIIWLIFGGFFMALGWASDEAKLRDVSEATLAARFKKASFKTKYYTPGIHKAAFQLPAYMVDALK